MNINEVKVRKRAMNIGEQLKFYFDNNLSVMLHGASGVGKSTRVEEIDPDYESITLMDGILPEEVIGLTIFPDGSESIPKWFECYMDKITNNVDKNLTELMSSCKINGDKISGIWVPPLWYKNIVEKCTKEPNKNHILFIDELTNVRPMEQSLVFHLVLNRSIGPNLGKLPSNCVVVCAGNSKEDSISAYNLPQTLFRRFSGHVKINLDFDEFSKWGKEIKDTEKNINKIHPFIIEFLRRKKQENEVLFNSEIFNTKYDVDKNMTFAIDPRAWWQVSNILYASDNRIYKELFENKLGKDVTKMILDFVNDNSHMVEDLFGVSVCNYDMTTEEQMQFYVDNGISFMLHGVSGIGKSSRVKALDKDFTSIELKTGELPEEIKGKTLYSISKDGKNVTTTKWMPPFWYDKIVEKCKSEPNKKHILFIDELTNASPSTQNLVYHLVLKHSIGPNFGELPSNCVVICAGNSKEESSAAYNMPEPLFRRFCGHIYLDLDIKKWLEWGAKLRDDGSGRQNIHPAVLKFVSINREYVFYREYDESDPPDFAIDPRGWEQVSDIIYALNGEVCRELIQNKIGEQLTKDFMERLKPTITVEDIVNNTVDKKNIPTMFTDWYKLITELATETKIEQFEAVRKFLKKYSEETNGGGEYLTMFIDEFEKQSEENALFVYQNVKRDDDYEYEQ